MQVATGLGEPSSAGLDLVDIVSLASLRSEDAKLQEVVANRVHADDRVRKVHNMVEKP